MQNIIKIIVTVFLCFLAGNLQAQAISNVPSTTGNTRYHTEPYDMKRPGLTIAGFDTAGNNQHGLGLKQILNKAYVTGTNETKEIFKNILSVSSSNDNDIEFSPTTNDEIEKNARVLQYKAFEALASYVLEKNGITPAMSADHSLFNIPIRPHSTVMAEIKEVFTAHYNNPFPLVTDRSDYVKNVKSYTNMARFLDLYLALENAYEAWNFNEWNNPSSTVLPTWNEKNSLFQAYAADLQTQLYNGGLNKTVFIFDLQADEVEPGNRPLKGYLALGLGDLVTEGEHYLDKTMYAASTPTSTVRMKYWMYQTYNGNRFWAEGPDYMHYVLPDAIQFWHTIRANNLLGGVTDPFRNSWFLNPVEWLADISTPDGSYPPIDDGNKDPITASNLLRWHDDYGNAGVAKKYNTVYQNMEDYHPDLNYNSHLYLLDFAIPKRSQSSKMDLPSNIIDPHEQQFVLRRKDSNNNDHYLLLVKEYGTGITRGEGHEQPDQLQLLYYVNEHSLVADAGYKSAPTEKNDIYNNYWDHNVMQFESDVREVGLAGQVKNQNRGGIPSPYVSTNRKVSDHLSHVNHAADFSEIFGNDKITLLRGKSTISVNDRTGEYERNIYLVEGNGDPYLIDLNLMSNLTHDNIRMRYHSGFDNYNNGDYGNRGWGCWNESLSNEYCINIVSNDSYDINTGKKYILEYKNDTKTPYRVDYLDAKPLNAGDTFSTIAFLRYGEKLQDEVETITVGNNVQIAYLKGSDTIDLVAFNPTNNSVNFTIEEDNIPLIELNMGTNKLGFVRLKKENSRWLINSDYNQNDSFSSPTGPPTFVFDGSEVNIPSFPNGSKIYLKDNATLKFTSTLNLNNAEVFLGENAKIEVRNGGNLTATGTEFKRLNANKKHGGVKLYTDGNTFTDCTFTGGTYGIYAYNSNSNYLDKSLVNNNGYGVYLSHSQFYIRGSNLTHNEYDGVRLYHGSASVYQFNEDMQSAPIRSKVNHNESNGIDLDGYSELWIFQTDILGNDSHDIILDQNSRATVGAMVAKGNKFDGASSSSRYIYSSAKTMTYETLTSWTVPAQYAYWQDGTAPSSYQFYGVVDYSNHLTEDPSIYNPPDPGDGGGDDCGTDPCPMPKIIMSASIAQSSSQNAESKEEQQRILNAKQELMKLKNHISVDEYSMLNSRWLNTYFGLLQSIDKKYLKNERRQVRKWQNKWLSQFHKLTSLTADSLAEQERLISFTTESNERGNIKISSNLKNRMKKVQLMGETAVLLEVEEALRNERYNRVIHLFEKYGSYLDNKDNQTSLLGALSLAYQNKKEYGLALGTIEQLEQIKPDRDMMIYWEAPDLEDVKRMLIDSSQVYSQQIAFKKAASKIEANSSELPEYFELDNSYPNPFNPTVNIPFSLPGDGKVRIDVFDITGRLVSVLSNQNFKAGYHQVTFNADNLASGVYLVRAQFGGNIETQKITLVK